MISSKKKNQDRKFFLDPSIQRKSDLLGGVRYSPDGIPLPAIVEISESGTCNRSCSFCPRSDPSYPDVKEFISTDLLSLLFNGLSAVGYSGVVIYSGFVEPLLDKKIFEKISLTRTILPNSKIHLVTNGDVLTPAVISKLYDSGLDLLIVSIYDGPEFERTIQDMFDMLGVRSDNYILKPRYLGADQSFGITLSNRSGMMASAEFPIATPAESLKAKCNYPSYTFFMDYLGDVLLCPHDWGKKAIMGNIKSASFVEIWTNSKFVTARRMLYEKDRSLSPCNICDVHGELIGDSHADEWYQY